jgi:hypothetical protein
MCKKCLEIKPIQEFMPRRKFCKICYKAYQHNFYLNNKHLWHYIKRNELNL